MKKSDLKEIVDKYFINDTIEPIWLKFDEGKVRIAFSTNNENVIGFIEKTNVQENLQFGIFDHKNFKNNINLLSDEVKISIENETILLKDNKFEIEYICADEFTMNHQYIEEKIEEFDKMEYQEKVIFDKDFITKFLNSSSTDSYESLDTFEMKNLKGKLQFILGKGSKIKFVLDNSDITTEFKKYYCNMKNFRNILNSNKDVVEGYMSLEKHLIKLEFLNQNHCTSVYYLPTESHSH